MLLIPLALAAAWSLPYQPDCSKPELCRCPWREVLPAAELRVLGADFHPYTVAQCPGQEWCDWRVFDDPAGVVAYHSSSPYRRDALPPGLKIPAGKHAWHPDGHRLVTPVDDGWIIAHGFAAHRPGLWWVAEDGARHRFFGEFRVAELIQTKLGIVGVTAIFGERQGDDRQGKGDVLLVERTRDRGWRARLIAGVGTAAWTATRAPDGSIFVVTGTELVRVTLGGKVTVLHTGRWNELLDVSTGPSLVAMAAPFQPNSIVVRPAGDIFIGMRAAVVHLVPRKTGYREEWLVPRTCAK
jgi:hypothetical protein